MFKPVDTKVNFPELEEKIIKYWKKNKTFEKSVEFRPKGNTWTFLDGPPFITGMPHYGSLLSSIPKDVFPRFWTMKGYRVRRVWGWDCHGLPAENKVETQLGLKNKREIEEKIGVKKFIDECKLYVSNISQEWEWYIDHIGRWVDFKNAYRTMDISYMESVMWVFKQMYDKGLIYKGLRVSLYCPHCSTPISNFEIAMDAADNYKEVSDAATTYKYKLVDNKDTFILAWSTTPWNKIVTPALAVNPKFTYVKVIQGKEKYILAESTLKMLDGSYEILERFKGKALIGKKFVPHYDYYRIKPGEKAFIIIGGDFVTAEEGTGVVTIAAYGEEDLKVMQQQNVHVEIHLDEEGVIKPDVPLFGGMYYLKANEAVNNDLEKRGLIYKDQNLPHNVPLCWRCHTRLYYAPQDAWYVDIQKLKTKLKKTNKLVNWFPGHFKYGRFLKSLESAPDWNISRTRYWGSPVPVWECECGERFVPGSIRELEEASGQKITDLHKPLIDEVVVKCKKCGRSANRAAEILDSWIEAGSASFGERHFPFEKDQKLEEFYPPDFIGEYTGQIRAWFYVLHVIGGALFNSPAFKNVLVEGVILGTDGRKMSKNYKNYPDPREMIQKYGGDALRLYLLGSPVMHGEDILISEEQYRNQVKGMMLIVWNIYNFFVSYALVDKWSRKALPNASSYILDRWVLSLLNNLVRGITRDLESFDTISAISRFQKFIDDFSTWYIRRSRDRVGKNAQEKNNKDSFYSTCFIVLTTFCKLLAPFAPFISEEIYQNLTNEESVHLTFWPELDKQLINDDLELEMKTAREIVEQAHAKRKEAGIKLRQPLQEFRIKNLGLKISKDILELIKEELNVKDIGLSDDGGIFSVEFDTDLTLELQEEGKTREIIRLIQEERKRLGTKLDEEIDVYLETWPKKFGEEIKKKALVKNLIQSNKFAIRRLNE